MPRDVVFAMRFLGESQHLLQKHFHTFMEAEMRAAGMTQDTHPMIHAFIERHALLMRDFVFSGASLAHQFHLEDIERMLGDNSGLLRVDVWDQLQSHIEMAEKQFRAQVPGLPALLSGWETPVPEAPESAG